MNRKVIYEGKETERKKKLLQGVLKVMFFLALLGCGSGFLEPENQIFVTLGFYVVLLLCLFGFKMLLVQGRVILAGWCLSVFLWLVVAFVTLFFGGLKGENAAVFVVVIMFMGSFLGGRAALLTAIISTVWCAGVAILEQNNWLPSPIGPSYSPVNSLGALAVTFLLMATLLRNMLHSIKESEERYRMLFEYNTDALMTSEPSSLRTFTTGNKAALAMFGAADEERFCALGPIDVSPEFQLDGSPSVEKAKTMVEVAMMAGSHTFEWVHKRLNGEEFLCSIHLTSVTIGGRKVVQACIRDISELRRIELREKARSAVLEMLSQGASMGDILHTIVNHAEQFDRNMKGSILLVDEEGKHLLHGAAPRLPDFYTEAVNGIEIGMGVGCCGTAAFTGERVIVENIQTHPYWAPYKELADSACLAACWSEPIKNASGRVLGTFAMYYGTPSLPNEHDIETIVQFANISAIVLEKFRAEERLKASEEKYRSVIENISEVVTLIDANGFILYESQAITFMLGYGEVELVGRSMFELIHPDDIEHIALAFNESIRSEGHSSKVEFRFLNKAGGYTFLEAQGISQLNNPAIRAVVVTSRDITARKMAEDEIKNLNLTLETKVRERTAELQQMNEELETFNYSISHDLQTPLRSISGFAQILMNKYSDKLDDTGKEFLGFISGSAKNMGQMIHGLLNFAKLGRAPLKKSEIDMNRLVGAVLEEFRAGTAGFGASLILHELKPANGDPVLVKQVWSNLIENAVKYTAKKDQPTIEVGSFEKDGKTVYFVKDNGVGFDMKFADKLFKVFRRLHRTEEFEGTGVGLASIYRIVTKHGGEIWTEAKLGEGATFYFTLG